jgi:hypothetical protein
MATRRDLTAEVAHRTIENKRLLAKYRNAVKKGDTKRLLAAITALEAARFPIPVPPPEKLED